MRFDFQVNYILVLRINYILKNFACCGPSRNCSFKIQYFNVQKNGAIFKAFQYHLFAS